MAQERWYRIDQVAARIGITKRTLRYYEEIGLLDAPARTEGNYRLYTESDVERLERICKLKAALGLTLAEISAMIQTEDARTELRAAYQQANDPRVRLEQLDRAEALTRQQLAMVEAKLSTLEDVQVTLLARLARYDELRVQLTNGELND